MSTNLLVPSRKFDDTTVEMMDRPQLVSAALLDDLSAPRFREINLDGSGERVVS